MKQLIMMTNQSRPWYQRAGFWRQLVLWLGAVGIMAASFGFQLKIAQLPKDWAQTTLFILSILVEFTLIWVWNLLFSPQS